MAARPGRSGTALSWIGLSVVLLASASCEDGLGPRELVELELFLGAESTALNRPVEVRVTVQNSGSTRTKIDTSSCQSVFIVLDSSGGRVGPGGACNLLRRTEELRPGEALVLTRLWAGTGFLQPDGRLEVLDPGIYELRGRVDASSGVHLSEPIFVRVEG